MNKVIIFALVLSSALAAPSFAFAENNGPVTREQVKADLVRLEEAGYRPGGEDPNYPQDIQAAEQKSREQQNQATAYGSTMDGTSAPQ